MASKRSTQIRKSLKCMLTDSEKLEFAEGMGQATQAHQLAISTKKEASKQLTADVDKQANEIDRLGTLLANGYEFRMTDCERAVDMKAGRIKITRLDSGEIIEDRKLSASERQGEMDL